MAQLNNGQTYVAVTTNKTLTLADQGVVQLVQADGVIFTIPATAAGSVFRFRNGGLPKTGAPTGTGDDGSVGYQVSPQAADKIQGLGFTAADNKDIIHTKATARVGDELVIVGDGVDGYNVLTASGTYAREA